MGGLSLLQGRKRGGDSNGGGEQDLTAIDRLVRSVHFLRFPVTPFSSLAAVSSSPNERHQKNRLAIRSVLPLCCPENHDDWKNVTP